MRKQVFFALISCVLILSSCATIVSGTKQKVSFSSTPDSAIVIVDNVEVGKTPVNMKLSRKDEHYVIIKLDGYETFETKITREFNGWYLGNVIFGGLIGLIVDASNGAIYCLKPNNINTSMVQTSAIKSKNNDLYIAVTLIVDKNLQKVGQLKKLTE